MFSLSLIRDADDSNNQNMWIFPLDEKSNAYRRENSRIVFMSLTYGHTIRQSLCFFSVAFLRFHLICNAIFRSYFFGFRCTLLSPADEKNRLDDEQTKKRQQKIWNELRNERGESECGRTQTLAFTMHTENGRFVQHTKFILLESLVSLSLEMCFLNSFVYNIFSPKTQVKITNFNNTTLPLHRFSLPILLFSCS